MEEAKLVAVPYTIYDGEQQKCEKIIVVDAAKTKVIGDRIGEQTLLEDGVLFGPIDQFIIQLGGHEYGSETMDLSEYTTAVNACCASSGLGQVITFADPADKTFGDAPFALGGTASSGLTVTYTSSDTAVFTISGSNATVVGAGSATITAHQAGDGTFGAAIPVAHVVNVAKAAQTITFAAFGSHAHTDAPFASGATASSGLTPTLVSGTPAVATVSGLTITPLTAGTSVITASQAGNANYNAATPVAHTLTLT